MDQNQTPTPQPDYSFIVNQGGPAGISPEQPKKRNMKLIILIVLAVIALGVAIVAFLLPSNDNQQQAAAPQGQESTAENSQPQTPEEKLVKDFLENLNNAQYTQAFSLLAQDAILGEETNIPENWFTETIAPVFVKNYRPSPCNITTPNAGNPSIVESLCWSTNSQTATVHQYEIVNITNPRIKSMKIKDIIEL